MTKSRVTSREWGGCLHVASCFVTDHLWLEHEAGVAIAVHGMHAMARWAKNTGADQIKCGCSTAYI